MAERKNDRLQPSGETYEPEQVTRRGFLKYAWATAGVLALGEGALIGYEFIAPKAVEGQFGGVFELGAVDDYPPGSVTAITAGRFYVVRLEDGGFLALYRKCSHLGCAVPWEPAQGRFICPCHGSEFERDGEVLNAPAPRPLDRFPITIENGMLKVDTGSPIKRDHAQPGDVVYA